MKALLRWIQEFVPVDAAPEAIVEQLSVAGLEIEGIQAMGAAFTGVFTATILQRDKHPNADRLSLCSVRCGEETLAIVCGAQNMKAGDRVALAKIGAKLPGDFAIKKSKIRDVESFGMLCSEKELGLADTSEGILILPQGIPEGLPLAEALGLEDHLLEVNVTPNRGDCLSIQGIARELAANFDQPFQTPSPQSEEGKAELAVAVEVAASKRCDRYVCRRLQGVRVADSPWEIQKRLKALGIRPINNVVDITNYVMLELGQPMHAFDWQKIQGGEVRIRRAKDGETLRALDGREVSLSTEDLVIADAARPVAVAGIIGGEDSSVKETTTEILLESAHFESSAIRKTAKRLGISTESSYRFERDVDPNLARRAIERCTELLWKYGAVSEVGAIQDHYPEPVKPREVTLRWERLQRVLGVAIPRENVRDLFHSLEIEVASQDEQGILLRVPTFRPDLTREIDLIEEVARVFGYDKIPATVPSIPLSSLVRKELSFSQILEALRARLVAWGFSETIHYAFASEAWLKRFGSEPAPELFLQNPISEELGVLRNALLPQLLQSLQKNLAHGAQDLRLFELRPVYAWDAQVRKPVETWHLALVIFGNRRPSHFLEAAETTDFLDLKGYWEALRSGGLLGEASLQPALGHQDFLHPKRQLALKVEVDGKAQALGHLGELHPAFAQKWDLPSGTAVLEINLQLLLTESKKWLQFQEIPQFPTVERDLNLIVDEAVTHGDLLRVIEESQDPWIRQVLLFDLYRGEPVPEGKKALTYRIQYGDAGRTLTDPEVNQARERLLSRLKDQLGAVLR